MVTRRSLFSIILGAGLTIGALVGGHVVALGTPAATTASHTTAAQPRDASMPRGVDVWNVPGNVNERWMHRRVEMPRSVNL